MLQDIAQQLAGVLIVVDDQDPRPFEGDGGIRQRVPDDHIGRRGTERQSHPERRAVGDTCALRGYRASVCFDEISSDREAQSQPPLNPRGAGVGLPESIEHVAQEFGSDALSRVANSNLRL